MTWISLSSVGSFRCASFARSQSWWKGRSTLQLRPHRILQVGSRNVWVGYLSSLGAACCRFGHLVHALRRAVPINNDYFELTNSVPEASSSWKFPWNCRWRAMAEDPNLEVERIDPVFLRTPKNDMISMQTYVNRCISYDSSGAVLDPNAYNVPERISAALTSQEDFWKPRPSKDSSRMSTLTASLGFGIEIGDRVPWKRQPVLHSSTQSSSWPANFCKVVERPTETKCPR